MELDGTISLSSLTRFQYFHTLRRVWPFAAGAIVFLLVLSPLMGLAALNDPEWGQVLKNATPFMVMLLLWISILLIAPYRNARKQQSIQAFLREPVKYTLTSETFSARGASVSWDMAWDVVKNVRETKSLFLQYHHPNLAVIVPKDFFADEKEIAEWRQLIAVYAPGKQIEPVGIVGRWC